MQEDGESGLKLMGHRYYDPGTGRFITRDPAQDGLNWYRYCDNNPLADVDPSGLAPQKGHGKGGGAGAHKKKVRRPATKDPVGEAMVNVAKGAALATLGLGTLAIGGGAEALGDAMAAGAWYWETPQFKKQQEFRNGSPHRLPKATDAHHLIPKSKKWRKLIEERFGPDSDSIIDDPLINCWPWEKERHRKLWKEYDRRLKEGFDALPEDATVAQLIEYAKWLTEQMKSGL